MKKVQQGFTLIELMIVVAIIGILAAVAIPAYQDYIGRAQASEAAVLLGGMKTPIAEYYSSNGAGLPDLDGLTITGKYVQGIAQSGTGNTIYTATFKGAGSVNGRLAGETIAMTFVTSDNTFTWSCSMDSALAPKVCD